MTFCVGDKGAFCDDKRISDIGNSRLYRTSSDPDRRVCSPPTGQKIMRDNLSWSVAD
jgi:hypothetical protein